MEDPTFVPALAYRDPKAALAWLATAFDFELTMAIEGRTTTRPVPLRDGLRGTWTVMIGGEWNEWMRSPHRATRRGGLTTTIPFF